VCIEYCVYTAVPTFKSINDRPHDRNGSVGENVDLHCNAYAIPEASVIWFRDGEQLDRMSPYYAVLYVIATIPAILFVSYSGHSQTGFRPPAATCWTVFARNRDTAVPAERNGDLQTLICVMWRDPDDVPHCWILSPDKTEWWLISATLGGWGRCFVADQLWLMTRIREEEEVVIVVTVFQKNMWLP